MNKHGESPYTTFGTSEAKQNSRTWMQGQYRILSGMPAVPKTQQYWTLAGPLYNANGNPQLSNELRQMVDSKLITMSQYIGVDHNAETYEGNLKTYPDILFEHGDITEVMTRYLRNKSLNPGVVSLDTMHMVEGALRLLKEVIDVLWYTSDTCVVYLNIVMQNLWRSYSDDDLVNDIQEWPALQSSLLDGDWSLSPDSYVYTNEYGKSTMMTYVFHRGCNNADRFKL